MAGLVVHESTIAEASAPGDTARVRLTIESSQTGHLSQRVTRYARGTSAAREVDAAAEEVLFVTDGQGTLILGAERHALEPEVGVYLAPGETYAIEQLGGGELTVVSVLAPLPADVAGPVGDRRVTVRVADQPALPAGKDREFRFVITPDVGCRGFTQFVGWVPPGRARDHLSLVRRGRLHTRRHRSAPPTGRGGRDDLVRLMHPLRTAYGALRRERGY